MHSVAQPLLEGQAPPVQVDSNGRARTVQNFPDLVGGAVLQIVQGHALGLAGRQTAHGPPERRVRRLELEVVDRRGSSPGQPHQSSTLGGPPPAVGDGQVGDHVADVSAGLVVSGHLGPVPVGGEEGLLGQVLGGGAPPAQGVGEGYDRGILRSVEDLEAGPGRYGRHQARAGPAGVHVVEFASRQSHLDSRCSVPADHVHATNTHQTPHAFTSAPSVSLSLAP